jgi:c-di-GMP phosphodiesterase
VNSAQIALMHEIESLSHALALMGVRRLRWLVSMMLLSSIDESKPPELIKTGMIRAKMCGLIAEQSGASEHDRCYTLGLLSVLDAMLDTPIEEIVECLPLSQELIDGLVHRRGPLGEILERVINFEMGTAPELSDLYIESLQWVSEFDQAT